MLSFPKFYGRHHDFINLADWSRICGICTVCSCYNIPILFPLLYHVIGYFNGCCNSCDTGGGGTACLFRAPLVVGGGTACLFRAPSSCDGVCVSRYLVFCIVFCRQLFAFLSFSLLAIVLFVIIERCFKKRSINVLLI